MNRKISIAMVALLGLAATSIYAQGIQGLPRASPAATVTQTVGLTEISIDYHRPKVKERKIWGALVPFDNMWRAGANDNTTISFSTAVKIGGQEVPAGTYGLHMMPTAGDWEVVLSSNSTSWGSFTYDPSEDVVRVSTTPHAVGHQETLTYVFVEAETDRAVVELQWEKLAIPFEIQVDTHAMVTEKLKNDLRHLPRFNWQGWSNAAGYLINNNIEPELATQWIDRSIAMNKNGANLQLKATLLRQGGQTAEADALVAEAMEISTEAQVNVMGYQTMNAGNIDRAIEIFQYNVDKNPESWNTYDSLAEAYLNKGDKAKSKKLYKKAHSMAPDNQKGRIEGILADL